MKKIDHITLLAIVFIVLLFSIVLLKKSQVAYENELVDYKSTLALSSQFKSLKSNWDHKENIDTKLKKIINASTIKNITQQKDRKKITIVVKNSSLSKIDRFVNKLLNESFIIEDLSIKKDTLELKIRYR